MFFGVFMKYLNQLAIILIFSCLGELCAWLLPFPIPGALYGLVLLFTALCLKIVRFEKVEHVGRFLIEIMPLMFTPPAVALITKWDVLSSIWPQILVIIVLTTFIVMFVTGHVAQFVLKHEPHLSRYLPKGWHMPHPHVPKPFFHHHDHEEAQNTEQSS